MSLLFSCHGGMGSTFLNRRLQQLGYRVHLRPFIAFLPHYWPSKLRRLQRLTPEGYADLPSMRGVQLVRRRCGFEMDPTQSVEQNLRAYLREVQGRDKLAVIFSRPSTMRYFSNWHVRDVNFVIRHPLHSYVSYTKKARHFNVVEEMGGPNTEEGIEFWAREWNNTMYDALRSGSRIIRFEFAAQDTADDPVLSRIFAAWDSSKRNHRVLPSRLERRLSERVWANYNRVYERWVV